MNEAEQKTAEKIILNIVKLVVEAECDSSFYRAMLTKYGEFGFDLVEEYLKEKGVK